MLAVPTFRCPYAAYLSPLSCRCCRYLVCCVNIGCHSTKLALSSSSHSAKIPKRPWTVADIPSLTDKLAIVTGATGGIGFETALALAGAGANVILAGRNDAKGQDALTQIRTIYPGAKIEFGKVDLANLTSVTEFAGRIVANYQKLDILINNAGIMTMALSKREVTVDGFEAQFATNYLSHFALTAHLLPLLQKGKGRIISLSSRVAKQSKIQFEDIYFKKARCNFDIYCQSKLAMLMFALELQKRSLVGGWGVTSIAAHPGFARTNILRNGSKEGGSRNTLVEWVKLILSQSAADGALPTLFAATSPEAIGGGYYGPGGWLEMKGPVEAVKIPLKAKDAVAASKLWDISVSMTGAQWPKT